MPLVIMVIIAVLVAVVMGCGDAHRYDSRLTAADSLMRSDPDSALAIVGAVDRDSLADEGDRAYRDLLLTQARYRCYIVATSDSDINRALAYYRAHSGGQEKLTRAYIYKGAVMEELGYPDSAMFYYKTAEATAAPDDYFNLGYSNLRIAELYQSTHYNDSAVLTRMRIAHQFFKAINDTDYMINSIGAQALYLYQTDMNTAKIYLEKAIELATDINSPKRFFYQSKLAGIYFYRHDYQRSKDLGLSIIQYGPVDCDENQYFYYVARSYVKLNLVDSAKKIKSIIPRPLEAVDSMNENFLMAELAQADHKYHDHAYFLHQANMIQDRLMENAINSKLAMTEMSFDTKLLEKEMGSEFNSNVILVICFFLLVVILVIFFGIKAIKMKTSRYQKKLEQVQNEIKELMSIADRKILELKAEQETEREEHKKKLAQMSLETDVIIKKNLELQAKQTDMIKQVSDIIRHRNNALRELYDGIRVKSESRAVRSVIPLGALIKDLNNEKKLLHSEPKESFWNSLKLSVDGEFQGIASYIENKYPSLSERDRHLFLLMCANLPNQIIKICMDYYSDATVSNNKRRLIQEKLKLNMKFEDFIKLYLQGNLD